MSLLHTLTTDAWRDLGGQHTAREIAHQPAIWRQFAAQLGPLPGGWSERLEHLLRDGHAQVILTGAGTSAFIGELVSDTIDSAWPAQVRAVATTTLLSHPTLYLRPGRPLLLVSFARSGNSPESQAAVELARAMVPRACFLNITCAPEGRLAREGAAQPDTVNVVLPEGSCDQGFAMTSSYTTMALAALSLLGPERTDVAAQRIGALADLADAWLASEAGKWRDWGRCGMERVVYLGGGPLEALAREAALKLLELTGGRVLALANSPLGFRHGPKSVLDPDTTVVLFRSQDPHARRYDADLLAELRRDSVAGAVVEIDGAALGAPAALPDAWLALAYVLFAQVLALHQSVRLGLTPDNPFPDGTVNRVVQGVTIYRYAND